MKVLTHTAPTAGDTGEGHICGAGANLFYTAAGMNRLSANTKSLLPGDVNNLQDGGIVRPRE